MQAASAASCWIAACVGVLRTWALTWLSWLLLAGCWLAVTPVSVHAAKMDSRGGRAPRRNPCQPVGAGASFRHVDRLTWLQRYSTQVARTALFASIVAGASQPPEAFMAGATRGLTLFLKGSGAPVLIQSQFTLTGLPTPPPGGSDPISNGKKAWVVWRTGPQRTRLAQVRARAQVVGCGWWG